MLVICSNNILLNVPLSTVLSSSVPCEVGYGGWGGGGAHCSPIVVVSALTGQYRNNPNKTPLNVWSITMYIYNNHLKLYFKAIRFY